MASFLSVVGDIFSSDRNKVVEVEYNSQTLQLLETSLVSDINVARGGPEITISDNTALVPELSPLGYAIEFKEDLASSDEISLYVVRDGDTLSQIAKMFGVSINTIKWANDISVRGSIKPGQTLTILPISGIKYTIKKGDTLRSITKKHKGDIKEIGIFNGITEDTILAIGDEIIIPDGEFGSTSTKKSKKKSKKKSLRAPAANGFYGQPVAARFGRKTQGFHGPYQAVDFGAPTGTPVVAMAAGTVITVRSPDRWNGGYGGMVVIKHDNNSQTLYAHNSKNIVSVGQKVTKGEKIAEVGSTGRSTGPHVHFEVRGIGEPIKTPRVY